MNYRAFQAAVTLAGAAVIGTAMAIVPATGSEYYAVKPDAATTCNSTKPCVAGTNKGAGPGVQGVNKSDGNGLFGVASNNDGVNGTTYNPSGSLKARSGVYGVDLSTDGGTGNAGVSGGTTNGTGVLASSVKGAGVLATSTNGNGGDFEGGSIGVVARSQDYPFLATDQNGDDLFFIDNAGDVYYAGELNQFARTKRNQQVTEYAAKQTTPTMEHVGSARLIDGVARVALDPTFADAIDSRVAYHVFVTPNGDTRGLYVTGKSADGFVVRETQQGRGTLDFDYRIVATPLGHAAEHSHIVDASFVKPHAPIIKHPSVH